MNIQYKIKLGQSALATVDAAKYEGLPWIISNGLAWYSGGAWRYAAPGDANGSFNGYSVKTNGVERISPTGTGTFSGLDVAGGADIGEVRSDSILLDGTALRKRAFGCLYMTTEGSTAQSVPNGSTYTKITPFDATLGTPLETTPSAASDQITVDRDGVFLVGFVRTYLVGTADVTWHIAAFVNGVIQPQTVQSVKTASTASPAYAAMNIPILCSAGDVVDIRVKHDNGSAVNLTYEHATLYVAALD